MAETCRSPKRAPLPDTGELSLTALQAGVDPGIGADRDVVAVDQRRPGTVAVRPSAGTPSVCGDLAMTGEIMSPAELAAHLGREASASAVDGNRWTDLRYAAVLD